MTLEDLVMDDNDEVVYLLVAEAIMIANNTMKFVTYETLIDYHPTMYYFTLTRSRPCRAWSGVDGRGWRGYQRYRIIKKDGFCHCGILAKSLVLLVHDVNTEDCMH